MSKKPLQSKNRLLGALAIAAVGSFALVPGASAALDGGGFLVHAQNIEEKQYEATAGMKGISLPPGGGGGGEENPSPAEPGEAELYTVPDGNWTGATYGAGKYVAVSTGGAHRTMSSADGKTWTASDDAPEGGWLSVAYGGGRYVAVSNDGRIMSSTDGASWTEQSSNLSSFTYVAYGNGVFVAGGAGARGVAPLIYSQDGINWSNAALPPEIVTAYSSNSIVEVYFFGDKLVAATGLVSTAEGNISSALIESSDGANWKLSAQQIPGFSLEKSAVGWMASGAISEGSTVIRNSMALGATDGTEPSYFASTGGGSWSPLSATGLPAYSSLLGSTGDRLIASSIDWSVGKVALYGSSDGGVSWSEVAGEKAPGMLSKSATDGSCMVAPMVNGVLRLCN